jgi:hypothetical protein
VRVELRITQGESEARSGRSLGGVRFSGGHGVTLSGPAGMRFQRFILGISPAKLLLSMAVVVPRFPDRDHAPMGHFTDHMLKLNGCVINFEIMMQAFFHIAQDSLAD